MGFFDSWSDLVSAATPWSQVEAEAVKGGSSTTSTPAQKDNGGEGEAIDESAPTPDKKGGEGNSIGDSSSKKETSDEAEDEPEEEEEEEEEDLVDPKETFEEECKESKACAPSKHHFDECVERVTGAGEGEHDKKHPSEDCVEEFFHLAHCASQCAAPKLWAALK